MQKYNNPYLNALLSGKLSDVEKVEAECNHRVNGESTLSLNGRMVAECSVCNASVDLNTLNTIHPDEVTSLVIDLVTILENTKYMAEDILPKSSKAPAYFSIIPMLKKFPRIYEIIFNEFNARAEESLRQDREEYEDYKRRKANES